MVIQITLVALLLALAAVPLIVSRGNVQSSESRGALIGIGAILGSWLLTSLLLRFLSRRTDNFGTENREPDGTRSRVRTPLSRDLATGVLLALLTWISFYAPMRQSFWRGADDAGLLWVGEDHPIWSVDFDRIAGRPLQMFLGPAVSRSLAPDRIDGYLWVMGTVWFLNAWLLYLIVRRVLPEYSILAAGAAALLVICPSEPSRFYIFSVGMSYAVSLSFLLLSFWLLLRACALRNACWLIASCLALGMTLLSNEGQFPLALVGFLLIWIAGRDRRFAVVAAWAWFGTLLVLSARLIHFFMTSSGTSYQARQASEQFRDPSVVAANFKLQFAAIKEFFEFGDLRSVGFLGFGLLATAVTLLLFRIQPQALTDPSRRRGLRIGALLALCAIVLGILPFLHIANVFRTQYFSAPGQAVLISIVIALIATRLPQRWSRRFQWGCLGLLVLTGTIGAYRLQEKRLESPSFDRLTHVFQQLNGIAPDLTQQDLVVLHHADAGANPLACNFCLNLLAYRLLDTAVVQAKFTSRTKDVVSYTAEGVSVAGEVGDFCRRMTHSAKTEGPCVYPYQRVLLFRLSRDGNLQLMDHVPFELAAPGAEVEKYQPLAKLGSTAPDPIRFFRYESSLHVPADILPVGEGLLLDGDWTRLCSEEGILYREGGRHTSIIVNPQGRDERELIFEVAPTSALAEQAIPVAVVNQHGEELDRFTLSERQTLHLSLPMHPDEINTLSFRPQLPKSLEKQTGGRWLRLVTDVNRADPLQQRYLASQDGTADDADRLVDIHDNSLRLGENWHIYIAKSGFGFRWARADAELVLSGSPTGKGLLKVDLEPYTRGKMDLALVDFDGESLEEVSVDGRTVVELPVVSPPERVHLVRLRRTSDKVLAEGDPGKWDFRVFGMHYRPLSEEEYAAAIARFSHSDRSQTIATTSDLSDEPDDLARQAAADSEPAAERTVRNANRPNNLQ